MAHPANQENSIADDLLRNGYERWERLEGEKSAIGEDLKELFAELKGHGFTPKALRESFRRVRDKDSTDKQEHDAIVDLYVSSLTGARPAPARVENIDEFGSDDAESNLPDIIIDSPGIKLTVNADGGSRIALEGNAIKLPEQPDPFIPHPSQPDGSDLTTSPGPHGQVADNSETANLVSNEAPMAVDGDSAEVATAPLSESVDILPGGEMTEELDGADHHPAASIPDADKSVEALASAAPAPMYAEPGVITWESCPPEGVVQHEYSKAFATLGQDIAVIEDDLLAAKAGPIVKIGNVILDGWARYNKARSIVGLDGKSIEYPVVQYDGHDPLLDCIKWNLEGRILSEAHKRTIADRLAKLYPQRRGIVYAAFEGAELVDA